MLKAGRCAALSAFLLLSCADDGPERSADSGDAGSVEGSSLGSNKPLDFAALDNVVSSFLTEKQLAGATAVVVHKDRGTVHERGYGGFDKSRVSLIASSSKILSVGVLMSLVDSGKLDLDRPVSSYLGSWGMHKTDLTAAMLVSNSSGLVSLLANPTYAPYICQYLDSGTLASCSQTIYTAMDQADRIAPDTVFGYGGGQWQLAGGVAEVASGKSWSDLIKETYVTPCETPSLGYTNHFSRTASEGGGSTAYPKFFEAKVENLPKTDNPSIEGGAYITAGDYGKILRMHLRKGLCGDKRVLSEASVARMQVDRIATYSGKTPSPGLEGYGLGWWIDRAHPGVVVDPGAYGAIAWLDGPRNYGAFIVLEATSALGSELLARAKPALDTIFDGAK